MQYKSKDVYYFSEEDNNEDVNKDELYKILDLVNLLNNRVVTILERVNKNSSNNKYKLPVINKTEIKKTEIKKTVLRKTEELY